ncbi:hypothetical protein [Chryseobacterium flavum]|uniref:hypothetical protein n=1 Tax=Chryseobacterium flavum TaxID=415851 RepID=UPI0028ABC776|nr:hypothetical protein [Chryseobacterium flavum]
MKNSDNQDFKENALREIKEEMAKLQLSPFRLSKFAGVSDVGIAKVLDGRSENPSEKTIKKILDGIEAFKKQEKSPITLATINEKLDKILELLRAHSLDIDILYELFGLSPDSTEVKKLQEKVKKKLS